MFVAQKLHNKILEYQKNNNIRNRGIIADGADISLSALDKIISGEIVSPKVDTLEKICLIIGITLNELFDNPGWNTHNKNGPVHSVSESGVQYVVPVKDQLSVLKLQNEIIELQKDKMKRMENELNLKNELMEIKVENERLKNDYAQNTNARVGS